MGNEQQIAAAVLAGLVLVFFGGIAVWMRAQSQILAEAATRIKAKGIAVRDLGEPSPEE